MDRRMTVDWDPLVSWIIWFWGHSMFGISENIKLGLKSGRFEKWTVRKRAVRRWKIFKFHPWFGVGKKKGWHLSWQLELRLNDECVILVVESRDQKCTNHVTQSSINIHPAPFYLIERDFEVWRRPNFRYLTVIIRICRKSVF